MPKKPVVSQLIKVNKIYGQGEAKVTALNNVSLEFSKGEFVAIMGSSGCGKSTLLHCAAGLDQVQAGKIFLAGQDITGMRDAKLTKLRRQKVGFIFQSYNLIPVLSVIENILLPLRISSRNHLSPTQKKSFDSLIGVLGLSDRLNYMPQKLSGGQQQRVAAARALINSPAVVFADEPTGNLDSKASRSLLDFLKNASSDLGQTIVMVTHNAYDASFAQRVVFMKDGFIIDSLARPTVASITRKMADLEKVKTHA